MSMIPSVPPRSREPIMSASRAPRVRDYQRQRLYRWEDAEILARDGQLLSLAACQDHVDQVFGRHGRTGPKVKDGRGCQRATFCAGEYSITLPRHCRTLPIVLHEAAHGLLETGPDLMRFRTVAVMRGPAPRARRLGPGERRAAWSAHGPIFVAIYIALVAEHGIAAAEALRRSAIDCRLDVARFEPDHRRTEARPVQRRRSAAG